MCLMTNARQSAQNTIPDGAHVPAEGRGQTGMLSGHRCNLGRCPFFFYSFYERYHVGVSLLPLSLFMTPRVTQGLVLMVYVGLRSQENTPAHVLHFRGVWFHWPSSSIATLTLRKSPLGLLNRSGLA